jgi:hypothetical protein
VNITPSLASWSIDGVFIYELSLKDDISPYPKSSASIKMTFGFSFFLFVAKMFVANRIMRANANIFF